MIGNFDPLLGVIDSTPVNGSCTMDAKAYMRMRAIVLEGQLEEYRIMRSANREEFDKKFPIVAGILQQMLAEEARNAAQQGEAGSRKEEGQEEPQQEEGRQKKSA